MKAIAFILILFMGAMLTSGAIVALGGSFSFPLIASYAGGVLTTALLGMIPRPIFKKKVKAQELEV